MSIILNQLGENIKVNVNKKWGSRSIVGILRRISVPLIGALFQVYLEAMLVGTKISLVPRYSAVIIILLFKKE